MSRGIDLVDYQEPSPEAFLILLPTFLRGEEQFFYGMFFNCSAVTL